MKKTNKILLTALVAMLAMAIFAVCAFAYTPGTGYMKNSDGEETNIKYTVTEAGILTFEIDASATDKVQSTEIPNRDPLTGLVANWNTALPTFDKVSKVIIGDGITSINGMQNNQQLKVVEFPTSLTTVGDTAFESCRNLATIYVKGNDPVEGNFDLTNVTKLGGYCFDACTPFVVKLNPNLAGEIPQEVFKNNSNLKELDIPEGVTLIKNDAFSRLSGLATLIIRGKDTELQSKKVFGWENSFPAIKAPAGSKAEAFAKENGFTYINLETGEETKGTLPGPGSMSGSTGGSTGGKLEEFDPAGATAYGHSTGMYNGGKIVDTYWAYYADTKTLKFTSATTNYNETGTSSHCDKADGTSWADYKKEIEHIVVGPYIAKMSGGAFQNMEALKDIVYSQSNIQVDGNCFTGCTSLTTIWREGKERIEGRADASGFSAINDVFNKTAIKELVLPASAKSLKYELPFSIETIYAQTVTDELIAYAKGHLYNLRPISNPDDRTHEYYVPLPDNLEPCGGRSAFSFDEATGILTVYGAGKIDDIVNYYGGGSKKQPWFEIKDKIKHVVLSDRISEIGKYAFCECENLETIQIPDADIKIGNAAFEKCTNLKSIYRTGTDPIEGAIDISRVSEINSYTFAYDYLIASVIVNSEVKKIGSSVFEENTNLQNIYGVPGSYAEKYAQDNNLTFYDASTNTPAPIKCEMPETTTDTEAVTEAPAPAPVTDTESETVVETEPVSTETETQAETKAVIIDSDDTDGGMSTTTIIIIVVVAVVVVAAVVVVVVIMGKKKKTAQK